MARRIVALPGTGSMLALVLLLVVAAVLSNVPSAALASSSSSVASETTGGNSKQQQAPPPPSSPSSSDDDDDSSDEEQEEEVDPAKQQQKEKERQAAKEKMAEEEKVAQQEMLKSAKEKHLVSPTNGKGWYKNMPREFLDLHNQLRARYGVSPMKWDNRLARMARRWSNAMRKDCQLLHSGDGGQSVFRSHDDWNATAKDAVEWWGLEEPNYDQQKEKCLAGKAFAVCGHFALMVSKRSNRVGCARAECFKGGVFITCNYYANDLIKKKNTKSGSSGGSSSNSSSKSGSGGGSSSNSSSKSGSGGGGSSSSK